MRLDNPGQLRNNCAVVNYALGGPSLTLSVSKSLWIDMVSLCERLMAVLPHRPVI